jgi:hypothetical protein
MKNGGFGKIVLGTVIALSASWLGAADHYKVVNGPKDFYYGHISYIEPAPEGTDPVVLREGRPEPETAVLNSPIGPGDTVRTSADRRCEIQFDTGTLVRLDFNTEVRVETILARSLSGLDSISNLALGKGRLYVMYKEYNRGEMFQVLTPNAAIKMKHNSVVIVAAAEDGSTDTQVKYGKARVLFGADVKLLTDKSVGKGERLIVQKDDQFQAAAAIADTDFELWNKDVNAHFEELHEGLSVLPKPIQKLSPAVFYFAQTYGNRFGEWLWDDYYGYIWRPFIDTHLYPWGWQPYYYGQWTYASGQMFWVPQEPWGWVPYHLGVWQWDKKHGWVWLPGSLFASAWATWDFYFGYACWRPWSLFDWMGGYGPYGMGSYGFAYMNGGWYYNWPYMDGAGAPWPEGMPGRTVITRGMLKQAAATAYPVPSELKGTLKRVTAAVQSGDVRLRDSAGAAPRHLVFVNGSDLKARAVNEKALTWDQVPKAGPPAAKENAPARRPVDPRREAVRAFRGNEWPVAAPQRREATGAGAAAVRTSPPAAPARLAGPLRSAEAPAARFRDWNPDLRVARELGVRIEYSSRSNEVVCPELGISSRDREIAPRFAPHLTGHGIRYGTDNPVSFGAPGSSASSGDAASSAASGRSSTRSEGRESKGGEGGTIKK